MKISNVVMLPSKQTLTRRSLLFGAIRFHSTGINVLVQVRKLRPSVQRFSRNSETLDSIMCRCHVEFHTNWPIKVEFKGSRPFTFLIKYSFFWSCSSQNWQPHSLFDNSRTEFYPNRTKRLEITGNISFALLRKVWPSAHRFRRQSQLPNSITWRFSVQRFTQFCSRILRIKGKR